jgi:hypothetical protein
MKLSPLKTEKLINEVIVLDWNSQSSDSNYFGGKELVGIFNECGFEDRYDYNRIINDIKQPFVLSDGYTPNGRKDYVKHNIEILNKRNEIESIVEPLKFMAKDKEKMERDLNNFFGNSVSTITSNTTKPNNTRSSVQDSLHTINNTTKPNDTQDPINNSVPTTSNSTNTNSEQSPTQAHVQSCWPYDSPSNTPKVFISYSWDNEEHKKWVKNLCDNLRMNSIDAIID